MLGLLKFVSVVAFCTLAGLAIALPGGLTDVTRRENQVTLAVWCAPCYYSFMFVVNLVRPINDQIVPVNAAFEARMAAEAEAAKTEREYVAYRAAAERYGALHAGEAPKTR